MKLFVAATAIVYSSLTLAGYDCIEKDSSLKVSTTEDKVITLLTVKGAFPISLKGTKIPDTAPISYFSVKNFALKDSQGHEAHLKVIQRPVMTRNPCTGRRICDEEKFLSNDISAEFDYLGKVTTYDCTQSSI